jgi:hypothetical protein
LTLLIGRAALWALSGPVIGCGSAPKSARRTPCWTRVEPARGTAARNPPPALQPHLASARLAGYEDGAAYLHPSAGTGRPSRTHKSLSRRWWDEPVDFVDCGADTPLMLVLAKKQPFRGGACLQATASQDQARGPAAAQSTFTGTATQPRPKAARPRGKAGGHRPLQVRPVQPDLQALSRGGRPSRPESAAAAKRRRCLGAGLKHQVSGLRPRRRRRLPGSANRRP